MTARCAVRRRCFLPIAVCCNSSDAIFLWTNRKIVANVDWALLNFMKDWFPIEAKKKLQQNEREAAEEQMEELGFKEQTCIIA